MRSGFSLVELSIVLVILGLLTGGILSGQSLIRAAELRSVTTEFQKYQNALHTFRNQYFYLPGDMPNATQFWGSASCPATPGTGTQTCNGNGNGLLDNAAAIGQFGERFTFWQHLSVAGMVDGTYTGRAGPNGASDVEPGINVPKSRLAMGSWNAGDLNNVDGSNLLYFAYDYTKTLKLGAEVNSGSYGNNGGVLNPQEAFGIDTKIDDGLPAKGRFVVGNVTGCTDTASNTNLNASYLLTSNNNSACHLRFMDSL
ncbi:type II secretion system protein [Acuticoccus sediminis]|uniref:type II secretion system protein n=1 Tax=Acuticoccus sediminis TaxID=2184697 RepID=UPI001CFDC1F3|nr:type II secretion system protein [Acuticoccus sediminis]